MNKIKQYSSSWLFAVVAIMLIAMPVSAQETTAAIQGTVTDASGAGLPGVTVEATSTRGQTFTDVTTGNGTYRFPALTPGVYTVSANLEGFGRKSVADVNVRLGEAPKVDLVLQLAAVSEAITVTGEAPVVDVTSSATATSFSREELEYVPKGRDFTSIVAAAAGASNEAFLGGISIDGASGSENRFVIDGVDTTHPQDGVSGQNLITDFVEEVQVKSAGYAAEFGGSVGGVINAITKTGTNDFSGWVNAYYSNSAWSGEVRPSVYQTTATDLYRTFRRDDITRLEPGIGLGGPIMRDRLWFFAGYSPVIIETERTPDGNANTFSQEFNDAFATANVNGNIGSKFTFKVAGTMSPEEQSGLLPALDNSTPAGTDLNVSIESPTTSYSAYADFIPTGRFYMTGRAGSYTTDTEMAGSDPGPMFFFRNGVIPLPATDPRYRATGYRSRPLAGHSEILTDMWDRKSASLDANLFAFGTHAFKTGVQYEKIENEVDSGEPTNAFEIRWGLADRFGAGVIGQYGSVAVRRFRTAGAAESNNLGVYLQDSWSVRPNLVLNLGVRSEMERVPNYGFQSDPTLPEYAISFDFEDKIAPRLGFAWDVFSDQRLKAYGSYGSYYDITKLEMPRGSFGADKWIAFIYPLNTLDWSTLNNGCTPALNDPTTNPCPALGTPLTLDLRHPTNPEDAIDPDLKPMQQREFQLGTDLRIGTQNVFGVRYVNKTLIDTIEDIGFLVVDANGLAHEEYITGNPGKGLVAGDPQGAPPPQPEAIRDYQALEFSFDRRFHNNFSAHANYTYSQLEGNYSGLASSDEFGRTDPNVSRAFDALHNAFDASGNMVEGALNTDRPHAVELSGVYRAPFGTSVGVTTSWRSGTPISEQYTYVGVPFYAFGRENQGRTDALTATDLLLAHNFSFGGRFGLEASLNVLNLFDEDTVTRVGVDRSYNDICSLPGANPNPVATSTDNCTRRRALGQSQEWFFENAASGRIEQLINTIPASGIDPYFMQPLTYQSPRSLRVGLKLNF